MNSSITRRNALKRLGMSVVAGLAGTGAQGPRLALAADATTPGAPQRRGKKIIVAGGGIAGLCAAYELTKLGHDVTVLRRRPAPAVTCARFTIRCPTVCMLTLAPNNALRPVMSFIASTPENSD
jgi:shikimate 5-dehydrogenase